MPKIYSYSRISSDKQKKGTGLAQQKEAVQLEKLAEKYGLPVSNETFVDDGKSAYHGAHLEGALGRFLNGVDSGLVKQGSILALFSLDRLSRQDIVSAQSMFIGLLQKGIKVYSAIDDKLYGNSVNTNFTDLLMSMVYLERAHNESLHKSKRTKGNALKLIADHQAGRRSPSGFAYAIQSVGTHVWWCTVDPKTREVKENEVYFDVAKQVCSKLLSGYGTSRILDFLNANFPPPVTRKTKKVKGWTYASITKLHQNRALMGERTITIDGQKHVLSGYYPAVLSETDYYRLVDARRSRMRPRGSDKRSNFITGIGIAKCALCGAPVGSYRNRHGNITYNCLGKTQRKTNCNGWTCAGANLELEILKHCRWRMSKFKESKLNDDKVIVLKRQLGEIDLRINRLIELASLNGDIEQISYKLNELKSQKEEQEDKLKLAKFDLAKSTQVSSERWKEVTSDALETSNFDARLEVRDLMQKAVKHVRIKPLNQLDKNKRRMFIAAIDFNDGGERYCVSFVSSNKRYDDMSINQLPSEVLGRVGYA